MIRSAFVEQEEPNHTSVDLAKSRPDMFALRTDGKVPALIRLIKSIFQFHRLLAWPDYRGMAIYKIRSDRRIHWRLLLTAFCRSGGSHFSSSRYQSAPAGAPRKNGPRPNVDV